MTNEVKQPEVNVYSLFADTSPNHTHTVTFKDVEFEFTYRQLTWGEKSEIINNSYILHKGEESSRFSIARYWLLCITKMVTDSPFHAEPSLIWNEITISKLDPNVVEQLIDICPKVDTTADVEEVKKDSPEQTG